MWPTCLSLVIENQLSAFIFGSSLGGRKRSQFYYDMWNIKYLSKFKWDDLTAEIGRTFMNCAVI